MCLLWKDFYGVWVIIWCLLQSCIKYNTSTKKSVALTFWGHGMSAYYEIKRNLSYSLFPFQSKPLQRSSTIWLKEDSSSQRCPTPVSLCCIVSHDLIIWNTLPAYMIPDTRFWMSYIHIPLTLGGQIHVENNNTILSCAWVVKWFVGGLSIAKVIIIM